MKINIKNTKNNLKTIDALADWFMNTLKLDAHNNLKIRKGAREILKCTLDHKPEDRDFDNFITDMCYVGAKWLNYSDDDIVNDGKNVWMQYYKNYMHFFNSLDM